MCDEQTEHDNDRHLSRRQFASLTVAAAFAGIAPTGAWAASLEERDVRIPTPDGTVDACFVHPGGEKRPAVLVWPDILGLRPAFRKMAQRLAAEGYAVLVVNPYYRKVEAPVVPEGASFRDESVRNTVMPLKESLTVAGTRSDAKVLVDWLDAQEAVDTAKGVGVTGYCMGGPMVFYTAHQRADRVRAIGTFHGGGLVTDAADSPHRLVESLKTRRALVAIAKNDHERQPEGQDVLKASFAEAGLEAEVEVYDAMHGWCPPDSAVYDEAAADKAYRRKVALFEEALGQPA